MENNIFNIQDNYIGKVVSIDADTHEIEVYIPKLMPTLSYGFSDTIYSVDLQSEVLKKNTILCKPVDFKKRVPDVGSLVSISFLDGDIKKSYWREFDPFGTNKYLEFQKIGSEETLENFTSNFSVSSTSLYPNEKNITLGTRDNPFSEIFGNIKAEYITDFNEKLENSGLFVPLTRTLAGITLKADITSTTLTGALNLATTSLKGLMSSTDKSNLDNLVTLLGTGDVDEIVNTLGEVLDVFSGFDEGTNLNTELTSINNELTNINTALNNKQPLDDDLSAISALTGTLGFLKTDGAGGWSVGDETDPVFTASPAFGITTQNRTDWTSAFTHISSSGTDHTFIDQSVTIASSPQFAGLNFTNGEGTIGWGIASKTLEIPMGNGVVQQVGEELYYPLVKNATASVIPDATPVMAAGTDGVYTLIIPAVGDHSIEPLLYMGLTTQEIAVGATGRVTYFGKVNGVDTVTPGYTFGDILYVDPDTPGGLTNIRPISPDAIIEVGMVTHIDISEGRIFVRHETHVSAEDVTYDNSESNLIASNTQSAIDELQAIKASVDALSSNINLYPTTVASPITNYNRMVLSTTDGDYNVVAVDIPTGAITGANQLLAELASDEGIIIGNPGIVNVTTIGNIKKTSGNNNQYAEFYFEVYLRQSNGSETLIGTSNTTGPVTPNVLDSYQQFSAVAILNNGGFTDTDRIVIKYYGNDLGGVTGSEYSFQFGGDSPVRTLIPVPVAVVPSAGAAATLVDTSNFNGILSGTDDTVQKALDTIDDHSHLEKHITGFTWTDGGAAGPTATITRENLSDLSVLAIPSASNLVSGIITTGTQTFVGDKTFGNDVIITGNLTVQGDNLIAETTTVSTEDDVIMLRTGASTSLTTPAGIVINSYDGTNHGGIIIDPVRLGELRIGDLTLDGNGKVDDTSATQPVLTRDEVANLADLDIMIWDATNYRSIGKTIAELGLGVADGGSYNEITVTNDAIGDTPLTINGVSGSNQYLQRWQVNGTDLSRILYNGAYYGPYISNLTTLGNAAVYLNDTGTVISRNVADANDTLIVNNIHASSTGDIQSWQHSGAEKARVSRWGDVIANAFFDIANTEYFLHPADATESLKVAGPITSTLAIGTSPFTITSTTMVANLNADLLDDQQGSYYLNYNNFSNTPSINDGTLTLAVSGLGLSGSDTFSANQAGDTTFTVTSNASVDATASTLAYRDADGNLKVEDALITSAFTMKYDTTSKSVKFVFV